MDPTRLGAIQTILGNTEAILEYYITDNYTYIFVVKAEGLFVEYVNVDATVLETNIANLRNLVASCNPSMSTGSTLLPYCFSKAFATLFAQEMWPPPVLRYISRIFFMLPLKIHSIYMFLYCLSVKSRLFIAIWIRFGYGKDKSC